MEFVYELSIGTKIDDPEWVHNGDIYITAKTTNLPEPASRSRTVWSKNSFVFFGTSSFTFCDAGGPATVDDLLSNWAVRFNIFTINPPPTDTNHCLYQSNTASEQLLCKTTNKHLKFIRK